jgi:hypothetical protein
MKRASSHEDKARLWGKEAAPVSLKECLNEKLGLLVPLQTAHVDDVAFGANLLKLSKFSTGKQGIRCRPGWTMN